MARAEMDKRCINCVYAILDKYEMKPGYRITGYPIGCKKSDEEVYQSSAQSNTGCESFRAND